MIGLGLSITQRAVLQMLGFSPNSLFSAGEQGAWYDPSDRSTMFQDAAGTTPVTAVEQPVGLILDKSKGLVLGPELVTNGDFSNGTTGWSASASSSISVESGRLKIVTTSAGSGAFQTITCEIGKRYKVTCNGFPSTSPVRIGVGRGFPFGDEYDSGTNAVVDTNYSFTFLADRTAEVVWFFASTAGTSFYDNISVRELPGNHAFQTTSTSRPVLKQDGSGKYYLLFDGVDDFLVTPTITPSTDKAQVFAGVRKLSDAATAMLVELSPTNANTGVFVAFAPFGASPSYQFRSKGTTEANAAAATGFTSPITNVLTGTGDIAGDSAILRVNGTQAASSTADQGTGNYGNYPLYIGRRGGTTLPFNGHLYSLIVRFGANLPAGTIASTESWVAGKTGITL